MSGTASPRVLIIAGMHRSGTTLTARWLHGCGLHLGQRLLRSKYDHANPDGLHYEDRDFLDLHKTALRVAGLDRDGYVTGACVSLLPEFEPQARELIAAREPLAQWGWKEPRTCLFLSDWRMLLPDSKLLVVYRPAEKVADSLLRRKLDHPRPLRRVFYRWRFRNIDDQAAHLIRVWERYNRDVLRVVDAAPQAALVLRTDDLLPQSAAIRAHLTQAWGFDLQPHDVGDIYEQKRLRQRTSYVDESAPRTRAALEQSAPIHAVLESWREKTLETLATHSAPDRRRPRADNPQP